MKISDSCGIIRGPDFKGIKSFPPRSSSLFFSHLPPSVGMGKINSLVALSVLLFCSLHVVQGAVCNFAVICEDAIIKGVVDGFRATLVVPADTTLVILDAVKDAVVVQTFVEIVSILFLLLFLHFIVPLVLVYILISHLYTRMINNLFFLAGSKQSSSFLQASIQNW